MIAVLRDWFFAPGIQTSSLAFQMAPDYDHLTLMEKVEVFEHAVNNTAGDDLAKLLWLKSPSSEVRRPEDDLALPVLTADATSSYCSDAI